MSLFHFSIIISALYHYFRNFYTLAEIGSISSIFMLYIFSVFYDLEQEHLRSTVAVNFIQLIEDCQYVILEI